MIFYQIFIISHIINGKLNESRKLKILKNLPRFFMFLWVNYLDIFIKRNICMV